MMESRDAVPKARRVSMGARVRVPCDQERECQVYINGRVARAPSANAKLRLAREVGE